MKLKMFELIDGSVDYYQNNFLVYQMVEENIIDAFTSILKSQEFYVNYSARIKTTKSIKSKIINNKYYLRYDSSSQIIDSMPDIIGVAFNCMFSTGERQMYEFITSFFSKKSDKRWQFSVDKDLYLDLDSKQPQFQKNGHRIYRIDGFYRLNSKDIRFEIQIKSLISDFWSKIEHEVIYKNNNILSFDGFVKDIMGTMKSNLEVIDSQLKIVYDQIRTNQAVSYEVDSVTDNFKLFLAKSINDLFNYKMSNNEMIEIDFKECSGILSQYIYLNDLIKSEQPRIRILDYFEQLNYLKTVDFSLNNRLDISNNFQTECEFESIVYKYFIKMINYDFEWHVFFGMLFSIEMGDNLTNLVNFIKVLKKLLFTSPTIKQLEIDNNDYYQKIVRNVATTLTSIDDIKIIYERNIFETMNVINDVVASYTLHTEDDLDNLLSDLRRSILLIYK